MGKTVMPAHDNRMALHTPDWTRTSKTSSFGGKRSIQLSYGRTVLALAFLLVADAGNVFEEIEFVIDETAIELPHAIGMPEEVRSGIRQVVARAIGNVMGDFYLFHLIAVDGMGTKVARNC